MKGKASSIPNIKLQDEAGKRLVNDVQKKLKEFLGKDYNDESLVCPMQCWGPAVHCLTFPYHFYIDAVSICCRDAGP